MAFVAVLVVYYAFGIHSFAWHAAAIGFGGYGVAWLNSVEGVAVGSGEVDVVEKCPCRRAADCHVAE